MESYAIALRRELHENAEIGFDLPKTLAILRRELNALGVEYTEKYGKSSIVATVNPEKSNFTIAVRADIDALPIKEENDVSYKSKTPGIMHACGHDVHAAIAMETLRRVYDKRDELSCRVKFIFQAAEEYAPSGAKLMAEDGVMDDIDCAVALHVDSGLDVGELGVRIGDMNAISDGFLLKFYGKSEHAARQHRGVDAIMIAMSAFSQIEAMLSKCIDGREALVFNVGSIHGGEANNIVCDECVMYCTLRTYEDDVAKRAIGMIKRICESTANGWGGRFEFVEKKHYPKVTNNSTVAEQIRKALIKTVGNDKVFETDRGLGGEDFGYFTRLKPGCMFRLGISNRDKGIIHGVHTGKFDIDERAIDVGINAFMNFIIDNQFGIRGI